MNNSKLISILAPARDLEVGIAAIQAGADAVYIGAPEFGARQAAGNSLEDIAELVLYAHRFGAQVLVTLNTLLHDDEYPRACALAHELYKVGVDALIIQDLNLLNYDLPPIRLHASTQCDNRTPEQVLHLQQLGFRRVVLARELSIDQIREINYTIQNSPLEGELEGSIELEAFVHGALCVSYSGRCYLSEALMDRSANRGCCAQLCRQRYDLLDKNGNEILDIHGAPIHQRYLLSLQDMDRSQHLAQMIEAGVTTFKIEGRLKDRDYVTNIVAYYRQLLDQLIDSNPALAQASTPSVYHYDFTPNPAKTFHRGQTDYFLHGRTPNMANWQTPKSTGEKIGKVIATRHNAICVELAHGITLHNGDGICYGDKGFAINRIEGDWIYPNLQPSSLEGRSGGSLPKVGTNLYRNLDNEFLRSLRAERKIPTAIRFEAIADGYRLTIGDYSATFVAEHQPATNPQRALQTIVQQLSKLGDTDFVAKDVQVFANEQPCSDTFPYFIPTSQLNQWRREVINKPSTVNAQLSYTSSASDRSSICEIRTANCQLSTVNCQLPTALMTCKYCILHELGHCRKINPMANEPRYLRLQNGTRLSLEFDCKNCEMRISKH
ncbi:MAG: U32 family peptidase [Paludibacteraceae bacterium]|nr:U32 family peptidase [Paludibacteraceae bacterium]